MPQKWGRNGYRNCTLTKNKATVITDHNVKNRSLFCWPNCWEKRPQSLYLFVALRLLYIPFPVLLWNRGGSLISDCFLCYRQRSVCTAGVTLIDLAIWHDWSHQLERDGCTVIWGCWTSIRPLPLRRNWYGGGGGRRHYATWLLGLVARGQSNLMRLHQGEREK